MAIQSEALAVAESSGDSRDKRMQRCTNVWTSSYVHWLWKYKIDGFIQDGIRQRGGQAEQGTKHTKRGKNRWDWMGAGQTGGPEPNVMEHGKQTFHWERDGRFKGIRFVCAFTMRTIKLPWNRIFRERARAREMGGRGRKCEWNKRNGARKWCMLGLAYSLAHNHKNDNVNGYLDVFTLFAVMNDGAQFDKHWISSYYTTTSVLYMLCVGIVGRTFVPSISVSVFFSFRERGGERER